MNPDPTGWNISELLAHGGWAMLPIYACSLVGLAVAAQRLLVLRACRLGDMRWLEAALAAASRNDLERAAELCLTSPHPAARTLAAMALTSATRPDRAEAEAARVGSLEVQRLERFLGLLSFIGRVAPLLGLLGTVIGMVRLFISLQSAAPGQVDVSLLAGGIWQALLTTAAGVCVAVPALAAHAWLIARVDGAALQIHDAVERFLTALPRSPLAEVRHIDHARENRR